ncbi:hypothetical protein HMI54_004497 [Coelomomyces lativittatus]|nr:hypothetical protein HMI54_004497 [Coelomomyces lativittatus]KAJ1512012.1 hypothetical protein HMI55_006386 [Coelomomyces lativittatus]KAJ1513851.1 hypothetical protein HMI56_001630 [Coelomomyces lativittatus]
MNMLQCYYERFTYNGYSARLSGSHYLLHHDVLVKFQGLPIEKRDFFYLSQWHSYKKPFQTGDQHFLLALKPDSMYASMTPHGYGFTNEKCLKTLAVGITFISSHSTTNPYEMTDILAHEIAHGTGIHHADTKECFGNGQSLMDPRRSFFRLWKPIAQCSLNQMKCRPSTYR